MTDEQPPARPWHRRWIVRLLGLVVVVVVLLCLFVVLLEDSFIYHPTRYPDGAWSSHAGFRPRDCLFKSADDVEIHAWYLKAEKPVGTVLYCHGNAGNLSYRAEIVRELVEHDMSVLIFDYRGFGRSQEARPSEEGLYADGRAAWLYLTEQEKVPAGEIVLFGVSLGGGVATQLATEVDCAGLMLQAAFTRIGDMAKRVIPVIPLGWALRHKFDNLGKIPGIEMPKLFVHGTRDSVVPFSHGKRLHAAATEPKELYEIRAGHNNLTLIGGDALYKKLRTFVQESVKARRH